MYSSLLQSIIRATQWHFRDENGFGDVEGRIDELSGQNTRVSDDGQLYYEYELDAGRSRNLISATVADV